MDKKLGFCNLHQGRPFFKYAVEAIYPQVDKIFIFYTDTPSQGYKTPLECPDKRQELYDDIKPFMDKVTWIDGHWDTEGEHVDAVRAHTKGCEWLVRFDADEIYQPGSVDYFVKQAEKTTFKDFRVPMFHFWRSFNWVCRDAQFPFRLERLRGATGWGWLSDEDDKYKIIHMGYAQPTNYIKYKMQVSAHKPEWRPNWYGDCWLSNAKDNIHPVSYIPNPLWNAEPFDKTKLPEVLKNHEYYDKEIIE